MPEPSANGLNAIRHGRDLLTFLHENRASIQPLLILTHDYPDPDALAAAFGLQHLATAAFGIPARIAYRGEIGRSENKALVRLLRIPIHKLRPAWIRTHAGVALVDTQPAFANNPFPENRTATIVLDQHPASTPPAADFAIVDPDCGATCVLVAQALLQSGLDIPTRVATAIAYGIMTDTLGLYRARRQDVVETYLQILPGADMRTLACIQRPPRPRKFFATLAKGIATARLYHRVLVSHLGLVDTPDRVSQVAEFLLVYRRARWCLVTGRFKGRLHASLRASQLDAQAGDVLRDAFECPGEAGGHGPIAGGSCRVGPGSVEESWTTRESALTTRLLRRLRVAGATEPRRPFTY